MLARLRGAPRRPVLLCHKSWGAREGGGAPHSGLGAQCFQAPGSSPPLVCKAQLGASTTPSAGAGAGPGLLGAGDPQSKSQGPGTKASPRDLRKGRTPWTAGISHTLGTNQGTQGRSKTRCMVRRQLQSVPAMEGLAEGLRDQQKGRQRGSSASPKPQGSTPAQCKRMKQLPPAGQQPPPPPWLSKPPRPCSEGSAPKGPPLLPPRKLGPCALVFEGTCPRKVAAWLGAPSPFPTPVVPGEGGPARPWLPSPE